jgi:chloride channel 3/4/5
MIYLNGYPFLDNKEEHAFGVPVSSVMAAKVAALPASGWSVRDIEKTMSENAFQGYPVVEDLSSKTLLGYIGRTELRYALDKARKDARASASAFKSSKVCFDTPHDDSHIDLSKFVDPTPLTVHPRLPLETVMELFKKMGPRAILIEYRGRLTGLVTVKDCLKYQFKVEAAGHGHGGGLGEDDRMEGLFNVVKRVAMGVDGVWQRGLGVIGMKRRGAVRLGSPVVTRAPRRSEEAEPFVVEDDGEELEDRGRPGSR